MQPLLTVRRGKTIYKRPDRSCDASGVYWYRHDDVYADDVKLEGFIRVQLCVLRVLGFDSGRNHEQATTYFRGSLTSAADPQWLWRQNVQAGVVPAPAAPVRV